MTKTFLGTKLKLILGVSCPKRFWAMTKKCLGNDQTVFGQQLASLHCLRSETSSKTIIIIIRIVIFGTVSKDMAYRVIGYGVPGHRVWRTGSYEVVGGYIWGTWSCSKLWCTRPKGMVLLAQKHNS